MSNHSLSNKMVAVAVKKHPKSQSIGRVGKALKAAAYQMEKK